jgi:hypothetical protein
VSECGCQLHLLSELSKIDVVAKHVFRSVYPSQEPSSLGNCQSIINHKYTTLKNSERRHIPRDHSTRPKRTLPSFEPARDTYESHFSVKTEEENLTVSICTAVSNRTFSALKPVAVIMIKYR